MKNFQKYMTYFFMLIFLVIFSIYNYDEYNQFHKNKIELEQRNSDLNEKIGSFELKYIEELKDVQFYYTPNKELLSNIVIKIEKAKKEILLETYMLTEKRIQEALVKAKKRGVNIKVILEKAPYMAYNINNKAFNKLEKAGINVIWSNKSNYSFNHTKVLLIDNLSIISTGNYSYSTFTKNRDFFVFTTEEKIYKKLKENFYNDYNGIKINIYDDNLIFSPKTSRIKFEKMFNSAKKEINMYFQYMKDDNLVEKLIKIKKEKNIDISIIIPGTAADDENTIKLKEAGIQINILPKYKMHAKAILIDEQYLFIGSINFSDYSIDRNREVGILLKNNKIINDFLYIYKQDIKKTY